MTGDRALWFLLPEGFDDPVRVSGGNVYDGRVRDGLQQLGWSPRVAAVSDAASTEAALASIPRGSIALVDGLVAGWAPSAVEDASRRVAVVILAHMVSAAFPATTQQAVRDESRALRAAARVIVTSEWTAAELARRELVDPALVTVAVPGSVDGSAGLRAVDHRELLCVGVVSAHKGQDVLLRALAALPDDGWSCTLAGSRTTDPGFADRISADAERFGGRVRMPGVLGEADLDSAYARAGLLVAPSRTESYGMAIADARRRGLPVIASAVGGIPEAVAGGGALLVKNGDAGALSLALHRWMSDSALRATLRSEASRARGTAPRWADTVARIDETLAAL